MIFVVSQVKGSSRGRKRPTLQVSLRRRTYVPDVNEGVVPKLVASRYVQLDTAGESALVVPGQHGYDNLARYLPSEEVVARTLANRFVKEFGRVTTQLPNLKPSRLWGKTVAILQNH
jgi:hypothetical protein